MKRETANPLIILVIPGCSSHNHYYVKRRTGVDCSIAASQRPTAGISRLQAARIEGCPPAYWAALAGGEAPRSTSKKNLKNSRRVLRLIERCAMVVVLLMLELGVSDGEHVC